MTPTVRRLAALLLAVVVGLACGAPFAIGASSQPRYNIKARNATGDGTTNDRAALDAAAGDIASTGGEWDVPPGVYKVATSLTIPAKVTINMARGARFHVASGATLTIAGQLKAHPDQQIFSFDNLSTTPVLLTAGGAVAYPKWFGAAGDGTTDDAQPVQAASSALGTSANGAKLIFGRCAGGYESSAAITVGRYIDVEMESSLIYTGSGVALTIGTTGGANEGRRHFLRVKAPTPGAWSDGTDMWVPGQSNTNNVTTVRNGVGRYLAKATASSGSEGGPTGTGTGITTDDGMTWDYVDSSWETNVGIRLYTPVASNITIDRAEGFTVGAQVIGYNATCAYNTFTLGTFLDNKIGLDLATDGGTGGAVNENVFFGGTFQRNTSTNNTASAYGIRITSRDGLNTSDPNANVFIKPSFELRNDQTSGVVTGLLVNHGDFNTVRDYRSEKMDNVVEWRGNARANVVEGGYDSAGTDSQLVYGTGAYPNQLVPANQKQLSNCTRTVFAITDLVNRYSPYSSTTAFVPGMAWGTSASGTIAMTRTGVTAGTDYLSWDDDRYLGVRVDTRSCKEFLVTRQYDSTASPNAGGRVVVQIFDSGGTQIDPTTAGDAKRYVRSEGNLALTENSEGGGCYMSGTDSASACYFRVSDDVYSAQISVRGGNSADVRLKGMAILTTPTNAPPLVTAGYATQTEYRRVVNEIPAWGTWKIGDYFPMFTPVTGGPTGWRCVVAGTPGTWIVDGYSTGDVQAVTGSSATVAASTGRVDVAYAGACALTLPASTYTGAGIVIKDDGGNASASNVISFVAGSGTNLEASHTIEQAYGSLTWYLDGTMWRAR